MRLTERLRASSPNDMLRAAEILRRGGLVAFPTETVYGLGANASASQAVEGIFVAKERPSWDPVIVHLASQDELSTIADLGDPALRARVEKIGTALWPGPLTLLLPRTSAVPDAVTAGRALVGVRVPAHPVARALLRLTALPIAAPSANRFGHVSPTTAQHVLDDLDGRIDAVLDGGTCPVGVESTVLDPAPSPMVLYRAGATAAEVFESVTGKPVHVYQPAADARGTAHEALPSPGVGIRHYAPRVPVILTGPSAGDLVIAVQHQLLTHSGAIGVLGPEGWFLPAEQRLHVIPWGRWDQPSTLAQHLFAGLRALEETGATVVLCPLPEPGGLRDALRDRLLKAARPR